MAIRPCLFRFRPRGGCDRSLLTGNRRVQKTRFHRPVFLHAHAIPSDVSAASDAGRTRDGTTERQTMVGRRGAFVLVVERRQRREEIPQGEE